MISVSLDGTKKPGNGIRYIFFSFGPISIKFYACGYRSGIL